MYVTATSSETAATIDNELLPADPGLGGSEVVVLLTPKESGVTVVDKSVSFLDDSTSVTFVVSVDDGCGLVGSSSVEFDVGNMPSTLESGIDPVSFPVVCALTCNSKHTKGTKYKTVIVGRWSLDNCTKRSSSGGISE